MPENELQPSPFFLDEIHEMAPFLWLKMAQNEDGGVKSMDISIEFVYI